MGTSSSSGAEDEKKTQKVHPFWGLLVILAALAVLFVMIYPFIASRMYRELPLPSTEETTVKVADRLASLSPQERARMVQDLFRNPNPMVRVATVEAIEDWKIRPALPLLRDAVQDNCSAVRRRAIEVFWKLERERGLRLLLAGLHGEDVDIRRAASSQLRFASDKRTVPAVIRLLDDPDHTTRFFALGVLRRLTGQPYFARTTDPPEKQQAVIRQWKQWWQKERSRWADEQQWAEVAPLHPTRTDPAPPFTLRSLDGSRLRLQDFRGRILVLHFTVPGAPPARSRCPIWCVCARHILKASWRCSGWQ